MKMMLFMVLSRNKQELASYTFDSGFSSIKGAVLKGYPPVEEEEEEEGLFKANAVNEEDPERDRATPA